MSTDKEKLITSIAKVSRKVIKIATNKYEKLTNADTDAATFLMHSKVSVILVSYKNLMLNQPCLRADAPVCGYPPRSTFYDKNSTRSSFAINKIKTTKCINM